MNETPPPRDESDEPEFILEDVFLSEADGPFAGYPLETPPRSAGDDSPPEVNSGGVLPFETSAADSGEYGRHDFMQGTLSIADLLESGIPVDWTEAVAIAQLICRAIAQHPSAGTHEYLLDPRLIEINERGNVRVLPGAPGGDPLVKQVGRILRALLEGTSAPVPLRLVASQAAFELPGFASVDDLSEALRSFEHISEPQAIRTAFMRGRDARVSRSREVALRTVEEPTVHSVPVIAPPIPPAPKVVRTRSRSSGYQHLLTPAALVVAALGAYLIMRGGSSSSAPESIRVAGLETPDATRRPEVSAPRTESKVVAPTPAQSPTMPPSTSAARRDGLVSPPSRASSVGPRATGAVPSARIGMSLEPGARGDDRGADRAEDIQRLYDAIVLTDPFYQLVPQQSTPAALAALRDSKRLLLPDLARRDYERAQEAFRAGDYDRASSLGVRVTRMLEEVDVGAAPAGLRESVRQLVARIDGARAQEDQRIYTTADAGVIPPAAIGRQLPLAPPTGLSNQQVGTLEMLISQAGQVEAVKLHTPLNRYHERMIVSAAKAWRYRPALRGGKPVRFRLVSSINLPES